jgi:putative transposase
MLRDNAEDLLAFTSFPVSHWKKIWSTNLMERLSTEIKRRTDVVGVFPTLRRWGGWPGRCWSKPRRLAGRRPPPAVRRFMALLAETTREVAPAQLMPA